MACILGQFDDVLLMAFCNVALENLSKLVK